MSLHIGPMRGRKSICLYEDRGSVVEALAYFRNDGAARKAMALLDVMARLPLDDPTLDEWHGWSVRITSEAVTVE